MTNYKIEPNNPLFDFESYSAAGINLSSAQVDRARELSDRIIDPERQWQTYLNSLALFGFETWLEERDSHLQLNSDRCSVMQPSYANYIDGVFNLTVGEYKICLLTNGVVIDEFISVERPLIDLPEYVAHFYVLVNVVEEQAEVEIDRFISYEEAIERKQAANLIADTDWIYEIPLSWFNAQLDDLLLSLRCLEPSKINLPAQVTATDNIQSQLEPLLSQLQSGDALHQILTWSQAAQIFSNARLLDWLYELQTSQSSSADSLIALRSLVSQSISEVTRSVINVKTWLANELDELAQNLAWTLLPPPEFAASGLRDLEIIDRHRLSTAEEFAAIITNLRNSGEDIPEDARGACQDFNLASHALRLFAVTWTLEESENIPEWSLLVVLGGVDNYLPQGLKLEVRESETILDEKIVAEDTAAYLYTQVIGELNEQFTVTITLANGDRVIFPTFVFS